MERRSANPIAESGQRKPTNALTHGHLIRGLDAEGQGEGTAGISETWRWGSADGVDEKRARFKGGGGANHAPLQKSQLIGLGGEDRTRCLFAEEMSAVG
jgi:hypothetical protein